MESHLCYTATRTPAEGPHCTIIAPPREELKVLIIGSVQEQDELCRAANIQKQQPSFDEDVYVNGKREPVMQRDEHLAPEHVAKQVHVELHFEDAANCVQRSASVRLIHCIVCIALWTGDVGSIKSRINNIRNTIVESWFLSDDCKSCEASADDFPVLVVVLNPGPLSLENFSRRVHEQLPSAAVVSAFEVNKSGLPQANLGFAQDFTHSLAFMADKFNLKMKNRPAHKNSSTYINLRPMSKPTKKGTSCC